MKDVVSHILGNVVLVKQTIICRLSTQTYSTKTKARKCISTGHARFLECGVSTVLSPVRIRHSCTRSGTLVSCAVRTSQCGTDGQIGQDRPDSGTDTPVRDGFRAWLGLNGIIDRGQRHKLLRYSGPRLAQVLRACHTLPPTALCFRCRYLPSA